MTDDIIMSNKQRLKKSTQINLGVLALIVLLITVVVFFDEVFVGIALFIQSQIKLNLVFDEGIDLADYDGGVILNCLNGGGCPAGISRSNDDTGEIESTEIVPKKAVPVAPTPQECVWIDTLFGLTHACTQEEINKALENPPLIVLPPLPTLNPDNNPLENLVAYTFITVVIMVLVFIGVILYLKRDKVSEIIYLIRTYLARLRTR